MKLAFFDDFKLGVIKDGAVVDVSSAVSGIAHTSPQDLINRIIENFDDLKAGMQQAADSGDGAPLDSVRLRPPLPKPGNVVAMAVNYMEDGTRDAPAPHQRLPQVAQRRHRPRRHHDSTRRSRHHF